MSKNRVDNTNFISKAMRALDRNIDSMPPENSELILNNDKNKDFIYEKSEIESLEQRVASLEFSLNQIMVNSLGKENKFIISIDNKSYSTSSNTNRVSIYSKHKIEIENVENILSSSGNTDAIEQFQSIKDELNSDNPKGGTIKGLWDVITAAVPSVKDALGIGKILAAIGLTT